MSNDNIEKRCDADCFAESVQPGTAYWLSPLGHNARHRPALLRRQYPPAACFYLRQPVGRADRPPDALGLAQRGIAQRLIELLAQKSREIADPFSNGAAGSELGLTDLGG